MSILNRAFNIDDLTAIARRRLPHGLYEFIDRGAEDEVTMEENATSMKRAFFHQRVGRDVSIRDTSTSLFGVRHSMPVGIGVTGFSGMLAYEGEYKLARAAAAAGVPYTLGNANFAPLKDIKRICGELLWRQLYPLQPPVMAHYVQAAKDAGVRVLVITMDSPVAGNREYMYRNGFMPGMMNIRTWREMMTAPRWFLGTVMRYQIKGGLPQLADMPEGYRRFFGGKNTGAAMPIASFTWEDVKALRRTWQDVLVLKGVSTPEDAKIAAECGVDGVIVSNHGGRSLDGCTPSFGALPAVVDAVAPKLTVMVDGGFKRGSDIVKAIALGASSVMVGRATTFGLAAAGEPGVAKALTILGSEISRTLALLGCRNLAELSRDLIQM